MVLCIINENSRNLKCNFNEIEIYHSTVCCCVIQVYFLLLLLMLFCCFNRMSGISALTLFQLTIISMLGACARELE